MKKYSALYLLMAAAVFFAACSGTKEISEKPVMAGQYTINTRSAADNTADSLANDAAISAAFTLDYRPQKAEGDNEAETLSAADLAGAQNDSAGSGTTTGGGLRKLSDYKTVYYNPAAEKNRIEAIRAAQESTGAGQTENANAGPLTVIDWGPQGTYSSAIQRPSIYVLFSQPMVSLAALGEQSAVSPFVSIAPPVKGSFRWYGTAFLSFEGDEPCQSQQTYTITVADNAVSLDGTKISGDRVFTFLTETLSMKNIYPGEDFRNNNRGFWFDNNSVPPEAARQIGIEFNYPVQADDIKQYLDITDGKTSRKFNLKQITVYKVSAELSDKVDFETRITVTLKKGAKSSGGTRGTTADSGLSFRTPGVFKVDNFRQIPGYGRYRNLIEFYFSYPLDESTVQKAVSTNPVMQLGADNVEVQGNTVRLYNVPAGYGAKFAVVINNSVKDIYGRNLNEPFLCDIVFPQEPPPVGEANFLDYGDAMLEAQFPPRFLFEYKNIAADSWYLLAPVKNPWSPVPADTKRITLVPGNVNEKKFEEMDLSPYLNEKSKGFIQFRANMQLLTDDKLGDGTVRIRNTSNELNLQVTDLGLTVRYGFNKTAVLVTSLSTGKPVEGARVRMLNPSTVKTGADLDNMPGFAEAETDANGLAVLRTGSLVLRDNTKSTETWSRFQDPYIIAEKDGDKAVFTPYSHSSWRFGVSSKTPQYAEEVQSLAFLFSDRGLYKPGETMSFRGVDRSNVLGMYTVYQGDYTIALEADTYRPQRYVEIKGTTTSSGSFFGTINIPDDLNPGAYRLVYARADNPNTYIANIPITVAYFERLKFQASLSAPAAAIINGDDINLKLNASYLSGGSLSGASWESAWYSQMSTFRPRGIDMRGYIFGPRRVWDSQRYIASDKGVLSGQGSASISQKSGGDVIGAPYIYQAEARVTDISNQMVSAYRTVMVHPALFYIGLYRGSGGFAQAGQELSYDFILANTDGEKTSGSGLLLQTGEGAGSLKAELVREEWRRVQQPGVNGYIYDEYVSEQITDSVQSIPIKSGSGTIKVKPSKAGFYTLRVSAKDREGRTALTELNFYATGSGGGYWNMNNSNELKLTPDQDQYLPGDTAKVLLQSPLPEGSYLITVEREGIFTEEVRRFTEPVSVIEVPIARNFIPVVYVSISSYSVRSGPPTNEYGSPDLDKPKGYYGVTKLMVNPRARAFSVKVESDKKTYRPGEDVTMTLTATKDGKPLPEAELTLMAVDRGVLDLINYHVPDPIDYFYQTDRFPLAVRGGDSRSWLMDPVTYSVKNLAGGDGDSKIEERKDFNPTAVFEPMLITGDDGKVQIKFKLPDNLTTYRITVFGVRGDVFALKESEIAAQKIINVRDVVPRRMRERDTSEAGVLVTNLDSSPHTLSIKLDIGDPQAADTTSGLNKITGQAFVDGTAEQRVTVKSGENAVVYFDVAAVKEGSVSLNFTVNSDILNERLVRELIIEHPYVMETVTTTGVVEGSSAAEGITIPSFADNGVGSLSVTLDATRLGLLDSAITYLFRYPYGCLEQRSAAIMPLVVFGDYLDSLSLKSEVSNPRLVAESELKSWAKTQLSNGGFPYWPSGTDADFYVSLRIAHILAIAKSKNYNIPASLNIKALNAYLESSYQAMQNWQSGSPSYYYQSYLQSYMLYVLALSGEKIDTSRLAAIVSRDNIDPSVLAFAGMTYRILGRNNEATVVAGRLRNLVRMDTRGADITDPLDKNRSSFYGGKIEQLALTLQFFVDQYPGDQINTRLLYSLLENKRAGSDFWESTAVTVRVLTAIDALIQAENLTNTDVSGKASLAGTELLSGTFKGLGAKPVTQAFDFKDPVLADLSRDSTQQLEFTRQGTGNLYYTASLRYAIPSELQSFRDEGLGVFLSLYDINTGEEIKGSGAASLYALQSGKTYRATVRLSSSRDRTFVALRVPIPSGAEILDATFATTASYGDKGGASGNTGGNSGYSWRNPGSRISNQMIFDNEIQYFWDRFRKGETTVSFLFRTARRGVFPTPPAQAECMYESEIFGRSTGIIYTIE